MMTGAEYPITIVRGTDFVQGLRIRSNCEVQQISEWGITALLVNSAGATVASFDVTETDPTAASISLSQETTAALAKGAYQWQIWSVRDADGYTSQLLTGRVVVI